MGLKKANTVPVKGNIRLTLFWQANQVNSFGCGHRLPQAVSMDSLYDRFERKDLMFLGLKFAGSPDCVKLLHRWELFTADTVIWSSLNYLPRKRSQRF